MRKKLLVMMAFVLCCAGCGRSASQVGSVNVELQNSFAAPVTEEVEVTISATGDVTMGNYVGQEYTNSFNHTYDTLKDYSYFFKNVVDYFEEDDFTLVNLEGTLTTSNNPAPGRTYNIKGDPSYTKILLAGDVEAVSMENNHRRDFGEEGTADTVAALEAAGLPYAYEEYLGYYEVNGVTIGWVAVNPASWGASVEGVLEEGLKTLNETADIVLACCHWGIERDNYPTGYQRELGKKCIDWGADLVIGHHPHVLQGIEEYNGKIILYSLGNFSFGANKNPADKDTMIYQQTFKLLKTTYGDGTVSFDIKDDTEARMIPCSISSVSSRNDYCPTPLTGSAGQRVIDRVNTYSADYGVHVDENGVLEWTTESANE